MHSPVYCSQQLRAGTSLPVSQDRPRLAQSGLDGRSGSTPPGGLSRIQAAGSSPRSGMAPAAIAVTPPAPQARPLTPKPGRHHSEGGGELGSCAETSVLPGCLVGDA